MEDGTLEIYIFVDGLLWGRGISDACWICWVFNFCNAGRSLQISLLVCERGCLCRWSVSIVAHLTGESWSSCHEPGSCKAWAPPERANEQCGKSFFKLFLYCAYFMLWAADISPLGVMGIRPGLRLCWLPRPLWSRWCCRGVSADWGSAGSCSLISRYLWYMLEKQFLSTKVVTVSLTMPHGHRLNLTHKIKHFTCKAIGRLGWERVHLLRRSSKFADLVNSLSYGLAPQSQKCFCLQGFLQEGTAGGVACWGTPGLAFAFLPPPLSMLIYFDIIILN